MSRGRWRGGNQGPAGCVKYRMSNPDNFVRPTALLREHRTLARQAAAYHMQTDPEQHWLAQDMLLRMTLGAFPADLLDVLFQRGPGREPDLYDAFLAAQFIDALNTGQLLAGSFDVPYPPARRGDVAENQRRLSEVTMMGEALVDVTTGVEARFTALYHGGHEGRSCGDGVMSWSGPITLTTQNTGTGEVHSHLLPAGQCALLVGTASVYDVRYLLRNHGMVARWPRGRARITLLVRVDPDLWHTSIPTDVLVTLERTAKSGVAGCRMVRSGGIPVAIRNPQTGRDD